MRLARLLALKHQVARAASKRFRHAEPIAACFERGEAKFAGRFPQLEDELAGLTTGGDWRGAGLGSHRSGTSMGSRSPDRADAMVWALTELLLEGEGREPRIRRL